MRSSVMATLQAGESTHPILILLHGVTDSAAAMADAIRHFATDFHIIACDLRGHGFSPTFSPTQATAPVDSMVADCVALLHTFAQPVSIYGHSMGGAVAAAAAIQCPTHVKQLILEDPAWLNTQDREHYRQAGNNLAEKIQQMRQAPAATLEQMQNDYPRWSTTELAGWYQSKCQVDLDFVRSGEVSPSSDYLDIATAISMPTLLLSAQDFALIDSEKTAALATLNNPNLQHHTAKTGGHCLRRDNPEFFYSTVTQWLATKQAYKQYP